MTSSPPPAPVEPPSITDAHIGFTVQCVACARVGEVDDVTPGGAVIVRHDASTWCVIPAERVGALETWNARRP